MVSIEEYSGFSQSNYVAFVSNPGRGLIRWMSGIGVVAPIWLIGPTSTMAQNPQSAALKEIRDTAADICVTVEQKGKKNDAQLTGEVEAKVSGVAARLADLGVKGSGEIGTQEYQGVSQEALATALNDIRMCRQHVFDKLVDRLLPSGMAQLPPSPGQQDYGSSSSPHRLPPVEKARASEPIELIGGGWWKLSLYRCTNAHEDILCYFVLKQTGAIISEYKAADLISMIAGKPKLIDNFRTDHSLVRVYFINGRNQEKEVITLAQDDPVWLTLEFEGAAPDITRAQIVFGSSQLQGSIK